MASKKQLRFFVEARVAVSVSVNISAKSLDEALEKAKQMKLEDFIEILGDHNDSNFALSGVFLSDSLPEV